VRRFALKFDPMETDPGNWGHSLGNLAEIVMPCLDAAAPKTIVEIGAYAGDVTRLLVDFSRETGARIWSIDPEPQEALVRLGETSPQLELVRRTSLEALPDLPTADAYVIDGDHNYHTVSEELRLISEKGSDPMPLLICHDVCWPHARRDSYFAPEQIPERARQPTVEGAYVFPGVSGLHDGGLLYQWPARHEGGARNGVLTAIEDFLEGRDDLRFALVPAFFGLGMIWSRTATYTDALDEILQPWDRNPLVARLEANRVLHLAAWQREGARAVWCQEQSAEKDAVLRKLLQSGTFALAVAISRLRQRGTPAFSKAEIRSVLPEFKRS
jgi:Methyltransferase domain